MSQRVNSASRYVHIDSMHKSAMHETQVKLRFVEQRGPIWRAFGTGS